MESIYRLRAVVRGQAERGTRNVKVTLNDANGDVIDLNVWEVDRVLLDTPILSKGYSIIEYTFLIHETATERLNLSADLNY